MRQRLRHGRGLRAQAIGREAPAIPDSGYAAHMVSGPEMFRLCVKAPLAVLTTATAGRVNRSTHFTSSAPQAAAD
jgi:hypothetical protein